MAIILPSERPNPLEERLIMNAHIVGSMQRQPNLSKEDRAFLGDIFYRTKSIRYCDLSTRELIKLKIDVTKYSGIESGIINLNKGAVI